MSLFGARLREAFGGARDAEIARRLGVTQSAVKNYVDGRVPPSDTLLKIADLTNCSIHWLLTGEGPKFLARAASAADMAGLEALDAYAPELRRAAQAEGVDPPELARRWIHEKLVESGWLRRPATVRMQVFSGSLVEVPLVGRIAAGKPMQSWEDDRTVLAAQVWPAHWQVQALEVVGDSMAGDGIEDGDVVIYRVGGTWTPQDLCVARLAGDEVCLKRARRVGKRVRLESSHPGHGSMVYPADEVEILGTVVAIVKRPE